MQFLAPRSDRQMLPQFYGKYVHRLDVECPRCNKVTYQPHAPLLETEDEQVQGQREWLNEYLQKECPFHPDFLLTPDRPA
jgi:hypothetical protein